mmetsp:Transcript_52836/g.123622  ORF Transcript_52836/g.123622 Transcript_52836/m.123622 type:complete len:476 (-) Transcript_52836:47-1474(-)
MGAALNYLPEPVTQRETLDGEIVGRARFGVCGMQGWRRRMEDAHLVEPDLDGTSKLSLFAVFDGHGGRGVSRFAAKHLPELLRSQEQALAEGRYGEALRHAFFAIDDKLRTEEGRREVRHFDAKSKDDPPTCGIPWKIPKEALTRIQAAEDDDDETPPPSSESDSASADAKRVNGESDLTAADAVVSGEGQESEDFARRHPDEHGDDEEQIGVDLDKEDSEEDFIETVSIDPERVLRDSSPEAQGCTALVALVDWTGATGPGAAGARLVVANAGDCRCVLGSLRQPPPDAREASASSTCKVEATPLSEDHKPELDAEKARIEAAGGFVKDMPSGKRVQGDLNLSRALGDLRYKQRQDLPPAAQIVTADPEIRERVLTSGDQLLILGCDGIWERNKNWGLSEKLMSRRRQAKGTVLSSLCGEVCDWTLCPDMESETDFDGTGCDNMTILIVEMMQPGNDDEAPGEPPAKRARQDSA